MEPGEADAALSAVRPVVSAARRHVVRSFPWHARVSVPTNLLLNGINAVTGGWWWAFWPLVLSGFALALHYLLYKAAAVDAAWVAARTEELNLKSYDRSHIEGLKSRYRADGSDEAEGAP